MHGRFWLAIGGLFGALGVTAGAYHAHGLEGLLVRLHKLDAVAIAPSGDPSSSDGTKTKSADMTRTDDAVAQRRTLDKYLHNFEVAVRYQMYHALALVAVGLAAMHRPSRGWHVAGGCFVFGVLIFSGLLYALALTGIKILGAIVPIGGLALIVGWLAAAWTGLRSQA